MFHTAVNNISGILHAKYQIFLSDFHEIWGLSVLIKFPSVKFHDIHKIGIALMHVDIQTDEETDMAKLGVAPRLIRTLLKHVTCVFFKVTYRMKSLFM